MKVTLEAMRFHKHSSSQFSPEIFQSRVDQTIVPAINYDQIPMEEANWSQLKIKIHLRKRAEHIGRGEWIGSLMEELRSEIKFPFHWK